MENNEESLKDKWSKIWEEQTGLPSDVRAGWQEASKKNKLYAFGPFSVPLHVVEQIEEDTKEMLMMAGIKPSDKKRDYDPAVIAELQSKVVKLEKGVRDKVKQVNTLLSLVEELKTPKQDRS